MCCFYNLTWTSKGKLVMSMEQVDLKMAGGIQRTVPSLDTTAIVSRCSFSRVSALFTHDGACKHILKFSE